MLDDNKTPLIFCPMTYDIPADRVVDSEQKCIQKHCAWWDETSGECAVTTIAKTLKMIGRRV